MVAHVVNTVKDLFNETFVVVNDPEMFENLEVDTIKDILPNRGPLGGILSGLLVARNDYAFVIACDMPLVDRKLIREMTLRRHGQDVVVLSHSRGVEPLLGVYSKNCIKPLEESLFAGNLSLQDFLAGLKATTYEFEHSADEEVLPPFFNINTPQDYSRLLTKPAPAAVPRRRRSLV